MAKTAFSWPKFISNVRIPLIKGISNFSTQSVNSDLIFGFLQDDSQFDFWWQKSIRKLLFSDVLLQSVSQAQEA